jgi:hypothetical protein
LRLWCVFGTLVVLKLVLVSHEEVVTKWVDDSGFAQSAGRLYWLTPYGQYTHVRQPVYPLFLSATTALGIPTRLAAEGLWIAACAVLMRALHACGLRPIAAMAAAALCLLLPTTFMMFDRLFQDNLYATVLIAFLPSLGAAMTSPQASGRWRWGAVAAVTGAVAANTRPESVLIYVSLAGALGTIGCLWWMRRSDRALAWRRMLAAFLLPLAATLALTHAIKLTNYLTIGAYVTQDLTLPGMTRLYDALLAIPPKDPYVLVPIKRDVRELAYRASPTFATLEPFLDGAQRSIEFQQPVMGSMDVKDEYGAWTVWALRDAAWNSHPGGFASAGEIDRFYRQCASELRQAMKEGRLESRSVPISFVAPEWRQMLPCFPDAVRRMWMLVHDQRYSRPVSKVMAGWWRQNYDAVAGRRITMSQITRRQPVAGASWLESPMTDRFDRLKTKFGRGYCTIMSIALVLAIVGLPLGAFAAYRRWIGDGIVVLGVLFVTATIARMSLFALMDASGIPVETRYIFPLEPMLLVMGVIGAACISVVAMRARRPSPNPPQVAAQR